MSARGFKRIVSKSAHTLSFFGRPKSECPPAPGPAQCQSAWGPDADRRAKLLVYLAVEGQSWMLFHTALRSPLLDSINSYSRAEEIGISDRLRSSQERSAIRIIVLKRQYPSNTNLGIRCGRGRCPTGLSIRTSGGSRECGTPSVVGHEPIAHLNACPEHGEDAIDASKAEPFDPSRKHFGYVRAFAVGLIGQLGVGHSRL
jgi:hypothetical protein